MRCARRPRRGHRAASVWLPSGGGRAGIPVVLPVGYGRAAAEACAARRSRTQVDSHVMTHVKLDRTEIVRQIEQLGVVAVIRLRDPGKLRAVVDALMAGVIKALEVTMTVPGAVDLIR